MNATAMCRAAGKKLSHYLANQATKDFLEALSSDIGIPISALVIAKKGGLSAEQGTWIHPDVAVNLGQWCSPKFAVAVSKWVREWMTTGKVSVPALDFSDPLIAAKLYNEAEDRRRIAVAEVEEFTEDVVLHKQKKMELQRQLDLLSAKVDVAGHAGLVLGMPMGVIKPADRGALR